MSRLGCRALFLPMLLLSLCVTLQAQRRTSERSSTTASMIKESDIDQQILENFKLVRRANDGDAASQHELGLRYLMGNGFESDTARGAYWIRKAAEEDFTFARYNLGILFLHGWGVDWNPFEAYKQFKIATERGMPEAEYVLGLLRTENLIVSRDWLQAYQFVKRAADAGFEPAQKALAEFKKRGIGSDTVETSKQNRPARNQTVKQPQARPVFLNFNIDTSSHSDEGELLRDALSEASPEARKSLGVSDSISPAVLNDSTIITLFIRAGDAGSPEALTLLGRLYERGVGVRRDLVRASCYYLGAIRLESPRAPELLWNMTRQPGFAEEVDKRARAAEPDAQFALAGLAAAGYDNRISSEQAFALLTSAAQKHHVQSLIELGMCYQSGRWVQQDRARAMKMWRTAATLGNREADIRFTAVFLFEKDSLYDYGKIAAFFQHATEEGSVLGQVGLGYCYEHGIGISLNRGTAANLYHDAAQRGSESAYLALRRMHDEIRPGGEEFKIER